jgi:ribosome-associated translation inhibitor RaiA
MLVIRFRNLESSSLAKQVIHDRLAPIISKFSHETKDLVFHVFVELLISLDSNGTDEFHINLTTKNNSKILIDLSERSSSLYQATAKIASSLEKKLGQNVYRKYLK